MPAAITCVSGYLPEDKLTNLDLEKMVDTTDEWIRTRTGIQERRILRDPNKATSDMGAEAVKSLCAKSGLAPEDIDIVVCATIAAANAPEHEGQGHHRGTLDDELALLVVHGVLHLLGHDHEIDEEAERMEALEQTLLQAHHR